MWITPSSRASPTQIGYVNIAPACLHPGSMFRAPAFDSMTSTVEKLNKLLERKPLPGSVMTSWHVQTKVKIVSTFFNFKVGYWTWRRCKCRSDNRATGSIRHDVTGVTRMTSLRRSSHSSASSTKRVTKHMRSRSVTLWILCMKQKGNILPKPGIEPGTFRSSV